MQNYSMIKIKARQLIATSKPSPLVAGLLLFAVLTLLTTLSGNLLGANIEQSSIERYVEFVQEGNFESAMALLDKWKPSTVATVMEVVVQLISYILYFGLVIFTVNTVRQTGEACVENLLDGFGHAGKVVFLNVLKLIIVSFLTLLFIIPGVLALYSYRQALFLLNDNPEWSVFRCLRESRQMMKGHKWELFKLDFSFIGWFLLSAILPPAEIYVTPYTYTSWALFYEDLKTSY